MIDKADKILAKYEDDNEYHFHECDRAWIIGAMIELAESEVKKLNIHDVSNALIKLLKDIKFSYDVTGGIMPQEMERLNKAINDC